MVACTYSLNDRGFLARPSRLDTLSLFPQSSEPVPYQDNGFSMGESALTSVLRNRQVHVVEHTRECLRETGSSETCSPLFRGHLSVLDGLSGVFYEEGFSKQREGVVTETD